MEQKNIHKHLEQDIERLSQEVERLKSEGEKLEKKEVVKKSFDSFQDIKVSQNTKKDDNNDESDLENENEYLPDYLAEAKGDDDVKLAVERLLDVVFHKGLGRALRVSRKAEPFVQDAFHDALADKLLPILEEKGIL